ncbi:Threonine/homoserine efflux transporter RhtA [Methylobacillus rhizosphaerae]|uniref:Threonine/homoserine efflux transporter RhtA n=1 Tax=Methylobacillus rhizosphaerae TaxID=551994 RepID=A0A239B988_9PROT|nr:DMT family transporter [Methylobacillus rhizosphaerae]SNS03774.1 Threonine/homoserine efflux transporter RhtA [Methylobacillus rhizosphaerae]
MKPSSWYYSFLVFVAGCSFGALSTIVKKAYEHGYTLGEVTGSQVLTGVLMLWGIFLLGRSWRHSHGQVDGHHVSPGILRLKLIAAGVFPGLVGVCYYQCVNLMPASVAIVLLMQYLWISALIDYLVFGQRPGLVQMGCILLVMLGSCLAVNIIGQDVELSVPGIMFGLAAAVFYALFIMISGRMGNHLPSALKSALMMTGSCIVIFILFPPGFLLDMDKLGPLLKFGIPLGLLGIALPTMLFAIAIPRIGVALGAILSSSELPMAMLCSYLILKEHIEMIQWIGMVVILGAIIISNLWVARVDARSR